MKQLYGVGLTDFTNLLFCRFLAPVPISEHAPLLEYRCTEVNCNIYNIGTPAFSGGYSSKCIFSAIGASPKSVIIWY